MANVPVGAQRCDYFVEAVPSHYTCMGDIVFHCTICRMQIRRDIQSRSSEQRLAAVNVTCSTRGLQPSPGNFTTTNLTRNEGFSFTAGTDDFCCIESSQPILVMQYATGASTEPNNELGDPFLMTVPPVQQYTLWQLNNSNDNQPISDHFMQREH